MVNITDNFIRTCQKTVPFQVIQFSISILLSYIWPIDRTLSGATTLGQYGPGSDGNERVLGISQRSSITGTPASDCLVSLSGYSLGGLTLLQRSWYPAEWWHIKGNPTYFMCIWQKAETSKNYCLHPLLTRWEWWLRSNKEFVWRETEWRFTEAMMSSNTALQQEDDYRFQFYKRSELNLNIHKVALVEQVGRVFHQWPGGLGFNLWSSHTEDSKMVLDTSLLNSQHYKVRIKGKVEQSWERSSALSYTSV